MNVLLLRLQGPMQSWGVQSRFKDRDTGLEPSKSGVVGLLCAALGSPRDDDATTTRVAALRMGVRVDRAGTQRHDYHTAGKDGFYRASGKVEKEDVTISTRHYLADAAFLVALEDKKWGWLETLYVALQSPRWQLFLGRKAFVPSTPVWLKRDGIQRDQTVESVLKNYPWLGREDEVRPPELRVVVEDRNGNQTRPDQPISFSSLDRQFAPRRVKPEFYATPLERLQEV